MLCSGFGSTGETVPRRGSRCRTPQYRIWHASTPHQPGGWPVADLPRERVGGSMPIPAPDPGGQHTVAIQSGREVVPISGPTPRRSPSSSVTGTRSVSAPGEGHPPCPSPGRHALRSPPPGRASGPTPPGPAPAPAPAVVTPNRFRGVRVGRGAARSGGCSASSRSRSCCPASSWVSAAPMPLSFIPPNGAQVDVVVSSRRYGAGYGAFRYRSAGGTLGQGRVAGSCPRVSGSHGASLVPGCLFPEPGPVVLRAEDGGDLRDHLRRAVVALIVPGAEGQGSRGRRGPASVDAGARVHRAPASGPCCCGGVRVSPASARVG